jgi:hypothetical protein
MVVRKGRRKELSLAGRWFDEKFVKVGRLEDVSGVVVVGRGVGGVGATVVVVVVVVVAVAAVWRRGVACDERLVDPVVTVMWFVHGPLCEASDGWVGGVAEATSRTGEGPGVASVFEVAGEGNHRKRDLHAALRTGKSRVVLRGAMGGC